MEKIEVTIIILILINIIITFMGLRDHTFLKKYSLQIDEVIPHKDYKRIITSGFLHENWIHLIVNMLALYFFSLYFYNILNTPAFFGIYFGSLIGGNLFTLYTHKNHKNDRHIGTSSAIGGIIFATIAVHKDLEIDFLFTNYGIPSWVYAIAFFIISIYGINAQRDSISRKAYLSGSIIGLLIAITIMPNAIFQNYIPISLLLIPTIIFLSTLLIKPDFMIVKKIVFKKPEGLLTIDDKYNLKKINKEDELNALLDKISKNGIHKLSKTEKERLEELSR